jgi:beta-1,2-mannobiose phosphorylase / 1,2-beta-oligomannan phosphorylase
MIKFKKEGILLKKSNLEFENEGVLNPAVIREGNDIHMFYRAVRTGNYSSIGYCKLDGPLSVTERYDHPVIVSEFEYESHGVEDPRIVKIDDLYYLTYTAYDGVSAQGALATSDDLVHFEKKGIIVPKITYAYFLSVVESRGKTNEKYYRNQTFYLTPGVPPEIIGLWDKNILFFPRRVQGKLVFLHRIRPGIQIVKIDDISYLTDGFWDDYIQNLHEHIVMDPVYPCGNCYIGGGCPPIETEQGWLLIYHGAEVTPLKTVYSASAALLDLNDPSRVIARLPGALIEPELDYELIGEVNNVVFPTGTALFDDTLYIYYGAADESIAVASIGISGLLNELITCKI